MASEHMANCMYCSWYPWAGQSAMQKGTLEVVHLHSWSVVLVEEGIHSWAAQHTVEVVLAVNVVACGSWHSQEAASYREAHASCEDAVQPGISVDADVEVADEEGWASSFSPSRWKPRLQ